MLGVVCMSSVWCVCVGSSVHCVAVLCHDWLS